MKKTLLFAAVAAFCLTANAEVITLDLTKPTDPEKFEMDSSNTWKETRNSSIPYFSTQAFNFSHQAEDVYNSWHGFTVSQATEDGPAGSYGYYSNVKKGGLKGQGTPYVLAYYNEFWILDDANTEEMQSTHIIFDGEFYAREVYLNNAAVSYNDIINGSYSGYVFGNYASADPARDHDQFDVRIYGLDENYIESDEYVTYHLAYYDDETQFVNTEWEKVDLSSLGKVSGLSFTVVSTDQGAYGTNTSTYFALDGLTVSTTADEVIPTALENVQNQTKARKVVENGQIYIIRNGVRYNALGAQVK